VGFQGVVGMSAQGVERVDWRGMVPKWYKEFIDLFDPEGTTAELPPHRSFDHAIDLKEAAQPPWGPIYALSEVELEALKEYLEGILRIAKITSAKNLRIPRELL